eukprot:352901-Chlamydomonas_euryale.AAC.16
MGQTAHYGQFVPLCIVALMYADAMALLADSPDDLLLLLGMVDAGASKRFFIHAAKMEIMVVGLPMSASGQPKAEH